MRLRDEQVFCYRLLPLIIVASLVLPAGCAVGTKSAPSGFLGRYTNFQSDPDQVDILYYEKPGVEWKEFKKLQIDPVLVYYKPDAKNRQIDPQALKKLTDYFRAAVVKAVQNKYPVVSEPGADVLRIRAAITELVPSNVLINVVTSTALFVPVDMGGAAMEAEFLDSETGERLGAIVHKRVGTPVDMIGGYSKWGHAKAAFDYWAKELRKALDAT